MHMDTYLHMFYAAQKHGYSVALRDRRSLIMRLSFVPPSRPSKLLVFWALLFSGFSVQIKRERGEIAEMLLRLLGVASGYSGDALIAHGPKPRHEVVRDGPGAHQGLNWRV